LRDTRAVGIGPAREQPVEEDTMAAETPKGRTGAEDLQAQLDALKAEIASLAATLQADGWKMAEALKDRAGGMSGEAAARARAALHDIRAETDRLEDRLEAQVREKPLQSLLTAFGLGLIVSIILRR
jgi:ElaB/YqjD/DUF883 family membrane-anchored ribosome-binding protein